MKEQFDDCLLVSPGDLTNLFINSWFLLESVALAEGTASDNKLVTIYINSEKYFERLAAHCDPFYTVKNKLLFDNVRHVRLVASGNIYLCGATRRYVR